MPVHAAAVCPHPPILVPELAAGTSTEVADVLDACDQSVTDLLDAGVDRLVVVGAGSRTTSLDPPYGGNFRPWGVDLAVGESQAPDALTGERCEGQLPLSLLIGCWLLTRAGVVGRGVDPPSVRYHEVAADLATHECVRLGAELAEGLGRVGLLVMGDGSACRGEKAPGYADPRAEPFDTSAARALASADTAALLALDPLVAAQLLAVGRAPWQVLAAATAAADGREQGAPSTGGQPADGQPAAPRPDGQSAAPRPGGAWQARLRYAGAPYGVTYLVASWRRV